MIKRETYWVSDGDDMTASELIGILERVKERAVRSSGKKGGIAVTVGGNNIEKVVIEFNKNEFFVNIQPILTRNV